MRERPTHDPVKAQLRSASGRNPREERIRAFQKQGVGGSLPDFVVSGTQKGGTSSFYKLLCHHPRMRRAAVKEVHYFDWHIDKGLEWYRRCFPARAGPTITGEATPNNLFDPSVPERMAKEIPDASLIALLRNPVDRAYSHYQMQVRRATVSRTFEEAIEEEMARLAAGHAHHELPAFLARGFYAE
jgi:hypothetical protein